MKLLTHSWISITRQPIKTFIVFITILVLGSMVASSILMSRAIQATELSLRRRTPPVATVIHDNDAIDVYVEHHGTLPDWEVTLTPEVIEEIGSLPYVRMFDYGIIEEHFFSGELALPLDPTPYLTTNLTSDILLEQLQRFSLMMDQFEQFRMKGVFNPLVIDIEEGIIELLDGRVFHEQEIQEAIPNALVSQAFADANNLTVGTTFLLDQSLYISEDAHLMEDWREVFHEDYLLVSETIELEVIGIFTPTVPMTHETNLVEIENHMELNNRIYVPLGVARGPINLWNDYLLGIEGFYGSNEEHPNFVYEDILFVLYDSLYLAYFTEAAIKLLPEFWQIRDLTDAFVDMSASLEIMRDISNWIMLGATVAYFIILGLLIVIFLSDRKHEIGVYFALGKARKKIILQFIIEIFLVSSFSFLISLWIGNHFASSLSQMMIRNELAENMTPQNFDIGQSAFNDLNQMGHGFWMTHEEMLEAYHIHLDNTTIFIFLGVSFLLILLSTALPIIYLTKLSPKNILMKASIG